MSGEGSDATEDGPGPWCQCDSCKARFSRATPPARSEYQRGLDDGEHEGWINGTKNAATIARNMKGQPELTTARLAVQLLEDVARAIERALPSAPKSRTETPHA